MDEISLPGGFTTVLRRINVGCGFDIRPDYVNVDMNDFHGQDVVADIIDLDGFPAQAFDEVFAKDVLEHFPWRLAEYAMRSWNRVLSPGGELRMITTYLPGLARRVLSDEYRDDLPLQHLTMVNLFSMQGYPGDFHCGAFTERQLRFYASRTGFVVERVELIDGWLIDFRMTKAGHSENISLVEPDYEKFLRGLYRDVLGREADEVGLQGWLNRLADGQMTRRDVLSGFLGCEERQIADATEMAKFNPETMTLGI